MHVIRSSVIPMAILMAASPISSHLSSCAVHHEQCQRGGAFMTDFQKHYIGAAASGPPHILVWFGCGRRTCRGPRRSWRDGCHRRRRRDRTLELTGLRQLHRRHDRGRYGGGMREGGAAEDEGQADILVCRADSLRIAAAGTATSRTTSSGRCSARPIPTSPPSRKRTEPPHQHLNSPQIVYTPRLATRHRQWRG